MIEILLFLGWVAVSGGVTWGLCKWFDWRERRAVMRLAAKLDGWRPMKPYPGDWGTEVGTSYVDTLVAICPSDRTLYALKCAFEDEQQSDPQKKEY